MPETQTLYDRIGGKPALAAVVDDFYRRVLADELLAPLFAATDMARQRGHQLAFLTYALGGPNRYEGRNMRDAHRGRGITDAHFGAVAGHLQSTLQDAGVGVDELSSIMAAAAGLRDDVVGHE
ncbi:MAG: group 1 truncated hemoglobin [Planctomycetes bacterium]|nr:group 1 truncated hemoglobin [Planctomycetota bacterium]